MARNRQTILRQRNRTIVIDKFRINGRKYTQKITQYNSGVYITELTIKLNGQVIEYTRHEIRPVRNVNRELSFARFIRNLRNSNRNT